MAKETIIAPYGAWESPITPDIVAGSSLDFKEVHTDPKTHSIYLIEGRPSEKGRAAIVKIKGNESTDILPEEYSAKSKVHEYGGGAAAVRPTGDIIFTDAKTSGVFSLSPSGDVKEVIAGDEKIRYADFHIHPVDQDLIIAIQEDHNGKEVINNLAVINAAAKEAKIIVQGADFYSHPKFSPDGKKISWIQWNHPDMPWTGTELFVGKWENGEVKNPLKIAGAARKESIAQPKWHLDGTLLYCGDKTGFSQLYRHDLAAGTSELLHVEGFEKAEPGGCEFSVGFCTYVSLDEDNLVINFVRRAISEIILYNISTKKATNLSLGLVDVKGGKAIQALSPTEFVVLSSTLTTPISLYKINISTTPPTRTLLKSSISLSIPPETFSTAQSISFPRTHGPHTTSQSHAIFVPPHNPHYTAPPNSPPPPCIILEHGGPTSHVSTGLILKAQYFTSRGYAYCSINYGGSTGYGRAYREELNYNWGIVDIDDTVSCIDYLSSKGLISRDKVGITGQSAGGYTVLQALCSVPDVFAAGCSLYGIGNLKALADETHKFEAHYLFDLLFPSSSSEEEREKVYKDRSPCFNAEKIVSPLVLLQGSIDRVVPIGQAEEMERIVREGGGEVKLVVFEGEGHGFVIEKNIKRALGEEEALWKRCLAGL